MFSSSYRIVWILMLVLQVCGTTACVKESALKEDQQSTLIDSKVTSTSVPLPSQRMLDDVLSKVKSVRVLDCGVSEDGELSRANNGRQISAKVLFESSERLVLRELSDCLRIVEGQYPEGSRANLRGTPTFELTLGDGEKVHLGLIDSCLRWKAWREDAYLLNPVTLKIFLCEYGVTRPLYDLQRRLENARAEHEEDQASLDEFVQTMPKSLRDFLGTISLGDRLCDGLADISKKTAKMHFDQRIKLARSALSKQFPDESDQIAVLLEWNGKLNLRRVWHTYQGLPLVLLLEYEPKEVLAKVKRSSLSSAQWVGLSRYYSCLTFRQQFPSGYKPLDKALRGQILRELKATGKNQRDADEFEQALRNWLPSEEQ